MIRIRINTENIVSRDNRATLAKSERSNFVEYSIATGPHDCSRCHLWILAHDALK
ncbi:MAG: hypothetical protein AB7H97_16090 [Pseudobdellovibrionaceae bacterium]